MGFPSDSHFSFSHLTNKIYPVLGTCWVFVLPWNFPISMSPMILDMTNDKRHDMPKKPNPDALGDTWVNPYMNTRRSHTTDFAHKRWFKVVWWGNGLFFLWDMLVAIAYCHSSVLLTAEMEPGNSMGKTFSNKSNSMLYKKRLGFLNDPKDLGP